MINKNQSVYISEYVNQAECELIGYQFFYKNGDNKFMPFIDNIDLGTFLNPLVNIKQVGQFRK